MSACLPCDLEAADSSAVVFRDDAWSCDVAEGYDVPGWYVLRLRRHAEGWPELSADEAARFGTVSQRIANAIRETTGAAGVYFMSFGENYPHFHFLVIARPAGLAPEHRGPGILALREANRDRGAALTVAADVRATLTRPPALL
ncbi:HIT family protein [Microbacterium insulae]|uniref:HIT family protein n=1 Tax=Microbacterium insulae TaxID=483014 RepID=A0ABW3AH59_9MICO